MTISKQHVAILGASDKPHRYAHMADQLLRQHGHIVHPITHRQIEVESGKVYRSIIDIEPEIDTLTLYVNPNHQTRHLETILQKKPRRIIVNPGTESDEHEALFREAGIEVERACTLVMLRTGQFEFPES